LEFKSIIEGSNNFTNIGRIRLIKKLVLSIVREYYYVLWLTHKEILAKKLTAEPIKLTQLTQLLESINNNYGKVIFRYIFLFNHQLTRPYNENFENGNLNNNNLEYYTKIMKFNNFVKDHIIRAVGNFNISTLENNNAFINAYATIQTIMDSNNNSSANSSLGKKLKNNSQRTSNTSNNYHGSSESKRL
jgi:hypothetical protein